MPAIRAFSVLRPALELDGVHVGFLNSAEGGHAVGEVVVEQPGAPGIQAKHLGSVRYEEIAVTCGAGMSATFWAALQSMLKGDEIRHSGAIVGYDQSFDERERLEFTGALITEVSFPKLDGASKEAALVGLRLAPDRTRRSAGSGARNPHAGGRSKAGLLAANFRLTIDGLDDATKMVSRIDALSVTREAAGLEIPDLVITLAQSAVEPLTKWHEDFVVNGSGQERAGALELLAANAKDVLLRLELAGLGIFTLLRSRSAATSDATPTATASMYCEQLTLATVPAAP